jgi:hypothetical protein
MPRPPRAVEKTIGSLERLGHVLEGSGFRVQGSEAVADFLNPEP